MHWPRGQKVKGQGHTVTKTVTVARLLVTRAAAAECCCRRRGSACRYDCLCFLVCRRVSLQLAMGTLCDAYSQDLFHVRRGTTSYSRRCITGTWLQHPAKTGRVSLVDWPAGRTARGVHSLKRIDSNFTARRPLSCSADFQNPTNSNRTPSPIWSGTGSCILIGFYAFTTRQCRRRHFVFGLSVRVRSFVRSFVRPDRSCYHDISSTAWAISMKHIRNIIH